MSIVDGKIVVLPVLNANGKVTITITAQSNGKTVIKELILNINAQNDAPILEDIEDKIYYRNFKDKKIELVSSDIENDIITYEISMKDDSLATYTVVGNVLTLTGIETRSGETEVTVTPKDETSGISKTFKLKILPIEEGNDIENVGEIVVEEKDNTTTTTLKMDNNLVIETKEDTNLNTVSHEIVVVGKTIKSTSSIENSQVEFTETGVHTTFSDVNVDLEVTANVTGEASHVLKTNGKTTKATSEKIGAITEIKKDANNKIEIITSVEVDDKTSVKVIAKEDGSAEHIVNNNGKVSISTSKIIGAQTVIKENGDVETTSEGEAISTGEKYEVIVSTNTEGKTITKIIRIDSDGNKSTAISTLEKNASYGAGTSVEISQDDNNLTHVITTTPLNGTLVIGE
ncbi:hypothetical protein [Poseidonibacter sp.]|uniref:hypothetical protein n=1 Tax=Poseidonibacter sp. TaxID=2321188 RepID=UPI003C71B8A6